MHQEKIWNYFQTEAVESFDGNLARLQYVVAKILPEERQILNIGVGNGCLERLLQIRPGKRVYALDPSPAAIDLLRNDVGLDEGSAKIGYSQAIPFPADSFDVVCMSEVIEHLENDVIVQSLREVRRVLRPGGRFLGTVPADEDLRLSLAVCPQCGEKFHRWGHVQSFTSDRLRGLLESYFDRVSIRRTYLADCRGLNWKGRTSWTLKKTLSLLGVKGRNENYFFVAN